MRMSQLENLMKGNGRMTRNMARGSIRTPKQGLCMKGSLFKVKEQSCQTS